MCRYPLCKWNDNILRLRQLGRAAAVCLVCILNKQQEMFRTNETREWQLYNSYFYHPPGTGSLVRKTEHRNTIQHWHPVTDIALQPRGGSFSDGDSVFKLHLRSIFIWAPCACIHYTHILLGSGGSGMYRSMTPPHLMAVCHLISLLRSPARDHLHEEEGGHVTIAYTRY